MYCKLLVIKSEKIENYIICEVILVNEVRSTKLEAHPKHPKPLLVFRSSFAEYFTSIAAVTRSGKVDWTDLVAWACPAKLSMKKSGACAKRPSKSW